MAYDSILSWRYIERQLEGEKHIPGAVVDVHLAHACKFQHAVVSHSLTWWIVDSFTGKLP